MAHPQPKRVEPGPGQESVWDYPRPPRLEPTSQLIRVTFQGELIAETRSAYRVLETASPPTYYLPPADVRRDLLRPAAGRSVCEWKGEASYFDVAVGDRLAEAAAWAYARPTPAFAAIAGYLAFYPARLESCTVDGEVVRPQPGRFYGGWVTDAIVGPFKGEAGTNHW